jgi:hypothetical protein
MQIDHLARLRSAEAPLAPTRESALWALFRTPLTQLLAVQNIGPSGRSGRWFGRLAFSTVSGFELVPGDELYWRWTGGRWHPRFAITDSKGQDRGMIEASFPPRSGKIAIGSAHYRYAHSTLGGEVKVTDLDRDSVVAAATYSRHKTITVTDGPSLHYDVKGKRPPATDATMSIVEASDRPALRISWTQMRRWRDLGPTFQTGRVSSRPPPLSTRRTCSSTPDATRCWLTPDG